MAKVLSMDLRSRVVAAVQAGSSRRAAARRFGVSASTAVKLLGRVRVSGSAAPGRQGRPPGSGKLAPFRAMLIGWVEATPDITMPELAARLQAGFGVVVRPHSLSRLLCQAGWTYKKSPERAGGRARRRGQAAPAVVSLDPALAVPAPGASGIHR